MFRCKLGEWSSGQGKCVGMGEVAGASKLHMEDPEPSEKFGEAPCTLSKASSHDISLATWVSLLDGPAEGLALASEEGRCHAGFHRYDADTARLPILLIGLV